MSISRPLPNLEARTVRNVSFIGLAQAIALLLSVVSMALLARILTPEDFGIVALGMVFLGLFLSFQDFGVAPAIIQRDSRIDDSISVGLSLRWIIAVLLFLCIVGLSPLFAVFFGNPSVPFVLTVFSLNLFVLTFGFSSQTLLTRSLSFRPLAYAVIVQSLLFAALSIVLAYAGFSYWSLVIGSIIGNVAYVAVLRFQERRRFKPKIDISLMKELLGFGKHLLVTWLMVFVIFNIDQIVVARVLGVTVLGFYFIGIRFGRAIGEQIAGVVNRVLFPTMARLKDNVGHLRIGYTQSLRVIAIVTVPLSLGLSALSPLVVDVVLGPSWILAVVPLSMLSIQGLLNALITPASNVLISIGKPKYISIQSTVQAIAIAVAIYPVALEYGINGVSVLTTVLSMGVLAYYLLVFSRIFRVSLWEISEPLVPSLLSGVTMAVLILILVHSLPHTTTTLIAFAAIGLVLYVALLHVLSKGRDVRGIVGLLKRLYSDRVTP
jgi:O-antigen/teichoic acid export membrane protein